MKNDNLPRNQEQLAPILHEIMTQLSFAIVTLNTDAVITFVSPNITSLLGCSPTDVIGKCAREFLHLNDINIAGEHLEELLTTPSHQINLITKVLNKEGLPIWLEINAKNLLLGQNADGILLILRAVDERNRKLETLLSQASEHARQEERHYMATELHDNINQIITATKLLIETTIEHPNPKRLLRQSSANLTAVIEEIRKLARRTLAFNVADSDLAGIIKKFVWTLRDVANLHFDINIEESAESILSQDQKHQLFRIFQEAWNNTVKYANATKMLVAITVDHNFARLRIEDNGVGFNVINTPNGVGLLSVAKRVKALNGHFHIQSSESEGTIIQVQFPLYTTTN